MNQRIQEFRDQAKASVPPGLDPEQWLEVYHIKFAELIVRECISALDDADGSVHHNECLLKHFGVKE